MASFPGGSISGNIIPSNAGEDLGSPNFRWDAFIQQLDAQASSHNIAGNLTVDGNQEVTGNLLVDGSLTGNITGNVTGNVTGNLTGNVTGNVTGNLTGDVAGPAAANLTITTANGTTANSIQITAGTASAGAGGSITLSAGNGTPTGGNVAILAGNGNTVTLSKVGSYNGRTVDGLVAAYPLYSATAQGADIASTPLFTNVVGLFRVSTYIIITRVGSSSSTLPAVEIAWTDKDNGVAQSAALTSSSTANQTTTVKTGTILVNADASTETISLVTSGYASSGTTSMQYSVYVQVEGMGQ